MLSYNLVFKIIYLDNHEPHNSKNKTSTSQTFYAH